MVVDIHHHPFVHYRSRRFHVILLLMTAYFSMAIMTSNIGLTLSCMINSTAVASDGPHEINANEPASLDDLTNSTSFTCTSAAGSKIVDYGGSYVWSVATQGHIVGATFLGGMVSVFPGGLAIDHFSRRHLLLLSVLLLSSASVLVPVLAETLGPTAVIVLRFIMGVGEGIMIPGINGMLVRWFPLHEKSTAASLYTSGNQLAGIFGNPLAAGFCASSLGWPGAFYATGLLGFIWCVVWQLTVNNSPINTKWISKHEVNYLQYYLPEKRTKSEKKEIPWSAMARSPALLVVFYSSVVTNMMIAMVLVYIPVYFKDVLLLEVKQTLYAKIDALASSGHPSIMASLSPPAQLRQIWDKAPVMAARMVSWLPVISVAGLNGFYAALPHAFNLISKLLWGTLMDYFKRKKILTPTQSVKISQVVCMLTLSACFLTMAYGVDCTSHALALSLLCTIGAAFGLCISGFLTSLLSISPNFIGVITSTSQIIGFGGRVATPQIITYFKTIGTADEWRGILLVYSIMTAISAVVFFIWGSGDVQPWDSCGSKLVQAAEGLSTDSKPLVEQNAS